MSAISVCKNTIASNNKRKWKKPSPAIRVSNTKAGKVQFYSNTIGIVDKDGNVVARIVSTKDGTPVIKCGAKVGIFTDFAVVDLDE